MIEQELNPALMRMMRVSSKAQIAQGTTLFELVSADAARGLPAFSAGAHVTLLTPSGLTRRYSLCNAPLERDRYVIVVKREAQGLGGSTSMVDEVQQGSLIRVSKPKNDFPLVAGASSYLFIAGGIGITPIMSMMAQARADGRDHQLVYCTRDAQSTAFLAELSDPENAARCQIHHDHGQREKSYDFAALLAQAQPDRHVYCCGPTPLMRAVRELTRHWPHGSAHFEDFGSTAKEPAAAGQDAPFTVRLARKGISVGVPAGMSILDALRAQGLALPSSCESGTCGSCRTGLVSGDVEHRDFVLDEDEYATQIMICVSRARSQELVLDI